MKKVKCALSVILALIFCFTLSACGNKESDSPPLSSVSPTVPPDLSGQWKQINNDTGDRYQAAIIDGESMEIYWVSDGGDSRSLYWAGTYTAPDTTDDSYSWESINDKEKTAYSILASGDDSKTFTYEDGQISYSASAFGITSQIQMERAEWAPGLKIEPTQAQDNLITDTTNNEEAQRSPEAAAPQGTASDIFTPSTTKMTYFPFSIGGVEFSIPSYYEMDAKSTAESTTFTANTGDPVQLTFGGGNCTDEEATSLDLLISKELSSAFGDNFEVSASTATSLAGLHGSSITATGIANGISATINITWAYQSDAHQVVALFFLCAGNLQYDYLSDYNTIISSAKLADSLSPSVVNSTSGIRPEFKEAMDKFEAFFDEYVSFMQEFSNSNNTLSLLSKYTDYMAKYSETMEALDKLKETDMSAEETMYYAEVTTRIAQKLLAATQ